MITVDCVGGNCSDNSNATNPWADVAAVGLAGLAMVGGIAVQGHFQNKSQEYWAASFTRGEEECTTRYNTFIGYHRERGQTRLIQIRL